MDPPALPRTTGRPPATSREQLAVVALELFLEHGFDETSVDQIAAAAGVSRRTFFRYYPSKTAVLWNRFDDEVDRLRTELGAVDPAAPMLAGVHEAVVAVSRAGLTGTRELRARMTLINITPSLQGATAVHYAGWAQVVSDFVAERIGVARGSLFPMTIGRTVLAAALAAYDVWADRDDRPLAAYLDEVLGALADGFDEDALRNRVGDRPFTGRRPKRRP